VGVTVWEWRISPTLFFKVGGYCGAKFMQAQWAKRLLTPDQEAKRKFLEFLFQACLRHSSSDKCLAVLFQFEGARKPLAPLLRAHPEIDWKVTLTYGENDFFKRKYADELFSEGVLKTGSVNTVANCGHHLYFDDPASTLKYTLDSFFKIEG
jgi:pimeloyl-ACP methyl ester carboxylesterase